MCNALVQTFKLRQPDRCLNVRILEIKPNNGVQVISTSSAVTAALVL